MSFIFPDPIVDLREISGSVFLFFESPLIITPPSDVMTAESLNMLRLLEEKNVTWGSHLLEIVNIWNLEGHAFNNTAKLLKELDKKYYRIVYLSYPANFEAFERVDLQFNSLNCNLEKAKHIYRYPKACSEFVRHIFLERYLELDQDINKLFDYCDDVFKSGKWQELLVKSYFFRTTSFNMLGDLRGKKLLLTNEKLVTYFSDQSDQYEYSSDTLKENLDFISWELFRMMLSSLLDPLNQDKVKLINKLLSKKKEQINRFKSRCLYVAEKVDINNKSFTIEQQLAKCIRTEFQKELSDLLEYDRKLFGLFIDKILSDEKTWITLSALIFGIITNNLQISSGALIGSLSNIGAKAYGTYSTGKRKISESDLALIYTITKDSY